MFSKMYTQWVAGAVLTLAMAPNLLGTMSAQSLSASLSDAGTTSAMQLTAGGNTSLAAGTTLAIAGTSYAANDPVGLWINVPSGITISEDSLGQTDTQVVGTVIPLDAPAYADDQGVLTYDLDTTGLPDGTYSLVAHGLRSGV